MREFTTVSVLHQGNLALALAPALTPKGLEQNPLFFSGRIKKPLILARGLLLLADIAATRYFQYQPVVLRDPVLSAQGDRLRAECFSACNGVYARMDLLQDALDGEIAYGTTNVDIGLELRKSLMQVGQEDALHLQIGDDGLRAFHTAKEKDAFSKLTKLVRERPVEMPDRWIRALGNCVEIHKSMQRVFELKGMPAKQFIASLPPATGKEQAGWLSYSRSGAKLSLVKSKDSVYISGLHRLSALKRVMGDAEEIAFYAPKDGEKGPVLLELKLPGAKLALSLTAQSYQAYSGEGALLEHLAKQEILEHADSVASLLQFESKIDCGQLARNLQLSGSEMESALSVLAVSGKLGYDVEEGSYFHRELPDEPERVLKDNPRLIGARKLLDKVSDLGDGLWIVKSEDLEYRVRYRREEALQEAKCSCAWYLRHQNGRGPCKHILAVKLKDGGEDAL